MIQEGSKIVIVASERLKEMRLAGLTGNRGTVAEDLNYNGRKNKGYMVHFNEPYLGEYLWFVPFESVKNAE